MNGPYDDIIGLPHHEPERHPRMPRQERASQFAPFSALPGYGDAIKERGRHMEGTAMLSEASEDEGIADDSRIGFDDILSTEESKRR